MVLQDVKILTVHNVTQRIVTETRVAESQTPTIRESVRKLITTGHFRQLLQGGKSFELTPVTLRPGTDVFAWTKTSNTPSYSGIHDPPWRLLSSQSTYACFAPLAFAEDAANFMLCVHSAFSYFILFSAKQVCYLHARRQKPQD